MSKEGVVASIITIGDELLIGQVIDTNSAWIAGQLNEIGIWVKRRLAVGDNRQDIMEALDRESKDAQLVIITGGLGPTGDDITKPVLCEYFDAKMVMNETVLEHVRYLSEVVFKRPFIDRNARQAEVPDTCTVLRNERGSAPGMWFEKNGTIFISLPGVPFEMKGIMEQEALPQIANYFSRGHIVHRTIMTWGVGESFIAERVKIWEEQLPAHITLAYLPHYSIVRLRLTGKGENLQNLTDSVDHERDALKGLVADWMIAEGDHSVTKIVRSLLETRGQTIATAESCTGGYIAHLLTAEPGASAVYKGSVISYANEVKETLLHVSAATLKIHGAVSEETVAAMVKGVLDLIKTDYAIATSGIMGPDGGTVAKPVGLVWIAVGSKEKVITRKFQFRFDRPRNIELTSINALLLLRTLILESESVPAS